MEKNIKIHIKNRVAVTEGDPVIICGNGDYTVTFIFDEEWGQAFAKTARFKFNTAEGPKHIDQPFTGETVEVPELSDIREVEVGVYVGDQSYTTTGAAIRCKPCIRCGSGTPHVPTPEGGTLDGLPVYVVSELPKNPKAGDVIALNKEALVDWDTVRIIGREVWGDDAPGAGIPDLTKYTPAGKVTIPSLPSKLSFDWVEKDKSYMTGVLFSAFSEEGEFINTWMLIFSTDILASNQPGLMFFDTGAGQTFYYLLEGIVDQVVTIPAEGWYRETDDGFEALTTEELESLTFSLPSAYVADYCVIADEEDIQQMIDAGYIVTPEQVVTNVVSTFVQITKAPGLYIAEEDPADGVVRWRSFV